VIEATIENLLLMRLFGMAEGVREQMNTVYHDLGFEERFSLLVDKEKLYRQNSQIKSLLSQAHLRHPNACVEDIDFRTRRGLRKDAILTFVQNDWIRSCQNIIIIGPTGAGKTFLACALGMSAIRQGIRTLYVRLPRFVQDLRIARADGSYGKLLERVQRMKLLIIDDWGINPFADGERRDILEIMEDRSGARSTIITTQFPIETWHDIIGDPTLADAICDRLIHNAHKIILKTGEESMRKIHSTLT
jgi:DNA replication protein DnaC